MRLRMTGHEIHVGERRNMCKVLVRKLKEKDHLEVLGVDGRMIL
jgi:hypothetical protein